MEIIIFLLLFIWIIICSINQSYTIKQLEEIKKLLAEKQKQDELDTDKK